MCYMSVQKRQAAKDTLEYIETLKNRQKTDCGLAVSKKMYMEKNLR